MYIVIPPIELILICVLLCPILLWHDIVYLPEEHYCYVTSMYSRGLLWVFFNAYGSPLLVLAFIYLRITIFLRRQLNNQTLIVKQRQDRDVIVIQRIIIIVSLLMALGIPAVALLIMFYTTGEVYPLFPRIEWFFVSLAMIGLVLSVVIVTPQLKSIVLKTFQHNRVVPLTGTLTGSIPIRQKTTTL